MSIHQGALANIALLQQGADLLATVPAALYVRAHPPAFVRGIGPHLRHTLDHYACFLDGWRQGTVDYDGRERDAGVETSGTAALTRLHTLREKLLQIVAHDGATALRIKMDDGGAGPSWTASTVARELQFLVAHTVHHFALMAALLRLMDFEPGAHFGVAPSTLKHEADPTTCAR